MRKFLVFILAVMAYLLLHEGLHAGISAAFGELETIRWNVIGPEVVFKTPVELRSGFQWALISGISNLVTIGIGYLLLSRAGKINGMKSLLARGFVYYLTIIFLITDALNLSIGPFVYGGDALGIAEGLGVSRYLIQAVFLVVLLINRELIAQRLLPAFGVETNHLLLRPWFGGQETPS